MTPPRKRKSATKPATKPAASASKKSSAKKRSAAKRASSTPKKTPQLGGKLVSVFGPFNSRVLIEMSAKLAAQMFADVGQPIAHSRVIDAVERDLAEIRKRKPALADSQLGATAIALAYELENPYNSATSKSMCARALNETMDKLRELAPAKPEADGIDQLEKKRTQRRAAVRG